MFEKIKENPKSLAFTMALVLTILSIVFQENELISTVLALITSYIGLKVENFYKGPVEIKNVYTGETLKSVNEEESEDLDLEVSESDKGA